MEQPRKKTSFFAPAKMAYMAIFTALAFVVTFLEFPIFPAAPFLKLDFANVFFLIEGFMFGPIEAIISIFIKELLCFAKSSTGGVGEIANFCMSFCYIILPSICYKLKKGRGWVLVFLAFASVLQIAGSLLVNRLVNFPFFFGAEMGREQFYALWEYIALFNLIKSVSVSLITFFLYKPLSKVIKKTSEKFSKKKS